jgi:UDP-N-acetyl-D-glucosamine dehydrogenase
MGARPTWYPTHRAPPRWGRERFSAGWLLHDSTRTPPGEALVSVRGRPLLSSPAVTRIGIIGLGYVGLPLAVAFAEAGDDVLGVDIDPRKSVAIAEGRSYIEDVTSASLAAVSASGHLRAATTPEGLRDREAIIICLPTPLDEHRNPDLGPVLEGAEAAAANIAPGALLVLESTTYPGTTREVIAPILERGGARVGRDVFLAFSPERVDPGNEHYGIRNTPKIVGGMTPECTRRAAALYGRICDTVKVVTSPESAEMTKIVENTFRAVNIALVNEMAILGDRMGIDIWETIDAASTKPFGFMPFWPGPGLGGHCIPVDPFYLTWRAKAYDLDTEFVELAGRINANMPRYAVGRVARALNEAGKAMKGSRILLLGMAYKGNVSDLRESPSLKLVALLRADGALVSYHDPHVAHVNGLDMDSVPLTPEAIAEADAVVIATHHRAVDLANVVANAKLVVDLRNAVRQTLNGSPSGAAPANVDVL